MEFTIEDVLKTPSCYTDAQVTALLARHVGDNIPTTVEELLDVSAIPASDRLWLALELLPSESAATLRFRAVIAWRNVARFERYYPRDQRVRACARARLACARGETVDLAAAVAGARDAARSAGGDAVAARAAARDAARAAVAARAWAAARSAAGNAVAVWVADAARAAEYDFMIAALRKILRKWPVD